jgi:hypothetical protein
MVYAWAAFISLSLSPCNYIDLINSGVSPASFNADKNLPFFYDVLSTNQDREGRVFISTMEAKKYPIYASQWYAIDILRERERDDHIIIHLYIVRCVLLHYLCSCTSAPDAPQAPGEEHLRVDSPGGHQPHAAGDRSGAVHRELLRQRVPQ